MNKRACKKILIALDVPTIDQALVLVGLLKDYVGGFKVGLELCTSLGAPQVIDEISKAGGKVFLDLKFKDIPNTVFGAAKAATRDGVLMFNVHADGGLEMMKAAKQAAISNSNHHPLVIAVTLLTSISQEIMNEELGVSGNTEKHVVHLACLAQKAELDGVVCSPHEISSVKSACGSGFITVVPGVRPAWSQAGDQKRVMTPKEAVKQGADYLVIGRPITMPPSEIGTPIDAVKKVVEEIEVN